MGMSQEPAWMLGGVWLCCVKRAPPVHMWLVENKDEGLMNALEGGRFISKWHQMNGLKHHLCADQLG
jgi:hypothetical protein